VIDRASIGFDFLEFECAFVRRKEGKLVQSSSLSLLDDRESLPELNLQSNAGLLHLAPEPRLLPYHLLRMNLLQLLGRSIDVLSPATEYLANDRRHIRPERGAKLDQLIPLPL